MLIPFKNLNLQGKIGKKKNGEISTASPIKCGFLKYCSYIYGVRDEGLEWLKI
tara:strand:+ start:282 stop:440 length:159 start_codon:yes stop_codon:yes gene_type:complete